MNPGAVVDLSAVFTLMFVTLGPLKILGPFAQLTRQVDEKTARKIAVRAFVLALIAVLVGGFAGRSLALSWNLSSTNLLLTGGIIFFLVGLKLVMEQYHPASEPTAPLPAAPMAAALRITFPIVVTPYGIAALIVLLVNSHNTDRTVSVIAILVGIMALNLLAMLFARRIMEGITLIALQIVGAVLGVLQVSLALALIMRSMEELGIL